MKNIHILPAFKPSRLFEIDGHLIINREQLIQPKYYRNIYITSDEVIKDGYYLDLTHNIVMQSVFYPSSDKNCKKIILTDNKDLIKDGIQAIDDEFLEWFVNNPSCEYVDLVGLRKEKGYEFLGYEIIIPKEEPKKIFDLPIATSLGNALTETMKSVSQHEGGIKHGEINLPNFKEEVCTCTDECLGYLTKSCKRIEEPKQETLEEVAFRLYPRLINDPYNPSEDDNKEEREIWIRGAKWQAERAFSELFEWLATKDYLTDKVGIIQKEFEQFKKK